MGSFFDIATRVVLGALRSPAVSAVAKYAIRQATAAVVRDIRRRTATARKTRMSVS